MSHSRSSSNTSLLPRLLSKWGVCSRRQAEERVVAGRVTVRGKIVRDVMAWVRETDTIKVDGVPVGPNAALYVAMNKPRGVITTVRDEQGRRCVTDLLPPNMRGAMPVGRLDRESSGLLFLTNDHDLGDAVTSHRGEDVATEKVYRVVVDGHPTDEQLIPMRKGSELEEGKCLPARVTILERRPHTTQLEIALHEGKNRQIRRSLDALGLEVRSLVRIAIGPLKLGDLASGSVRELTTPELRALRATFGLAPPT